MSAGKLKIKLNNGVEIPLVAQGSWAPPEPTAQASVKGWILTALQNGFRHIDTASGYGTEKAVGEAIRASGIPREEIFVTTKLPWHHHSRVRESFEESLAALGTGYIDLYLLHWPQAIEFYEGHNMPKNPDGTYKTIDKPYSEIWAEIEKLLETGKVRAIGVSNFSVKTQVKALVQLLENLFKTAKVVPAVNQVELHPYLAQNGLRDYCYRKGIELMAYTPSGYDVVRNDAVINSIAAKYNVTANQVTLAWHLSRKTIIVPTSKQSERQKENINIPINILEEDLAKIWQLDQDKRLCNAPNSKTGQIWGWNLEQLGWEDYRPRL